MNSERVAPEYAFDQLARALRTLGESPDPALRARALARAEAWERAIDGMASGAIEVGDRTPVRGVPAWVTLEVLHGGFASGRLLAEEPPDEHELALLHTLSPPEPGESPRGRLNRHALSPEGQRALLGQLQSGLYRVRLPEQAALLSFTALMAHGHRDAALSLLETLGPFLNRLRFTPDPAELPLSSAASVHRFTVREVRQALDSAQPQVQVERMNEALAVWRPLTDQIVALLLETVDGEPPRLLTDESGALLRDARGQPQLGGGAPLTRLPAGWLGFAQEWLDAVDEARARYPGSQRPVNERFLLARFVRVLRRVLTSSEPLPNADRATLRGAMAGHMHRHGVPGSAAWQARREAEAAHAARPTRAALRQVLSARLAPFEPVEAIADPAFLSEPVREGEAAGLPAGTPIPEPMAQVAGSCLEAPVEELIERGMVPSAEVLAKLLPQLTAAVRGAAIADPALRGLFIATYAAFRRRRSLLLLDLKSQVRFEELPWVAALSPFRAGGSEQQALAKQALQQVCALTFSAFPHQILPNPLIKEMQALARDMGATLPMVEEIAADIFMGTFVPKFAEAAIAASALLTGSLYAHYYDLPGPAALARVGDEERGMAFAAMCQARVGETKSGFGSRIAKSGATLEQSQILTTHNLAVLFNALDLRTLLAPRLPDISQRTFRWILQRNVQTPPGRREKLKLIKNSAYAWRQLLFFLSMQPDARAFIAWARGELAHGAAPGAERWGPVLEGLAQVADGARFDARGRIGEHRRLLGWSVSPHWMLAEAPAKP